MRVLDITNDRIPQELKTGRIKNNADTWIIENDIAYGWRFGFNFQPVLPGGNKNNLDAEHVASGGVRAHASANLGNCCVGDERRGHAKLRGVLCSQTGLTLEHATGPAPGPASAAQERPRQF